MENLMSPDTATLIPSAAVSRSGAFAAGGLSDRGKVRKANEDHFLIDASLGLIALADGMGGHAFGAQASSTALATIASALAACDSSNDIAPPPGDPDATLHDHTLASIRRVLEALEDANAALHALNRRAQLPPNRAMGTTATGLWMPTPDAPSLIAFQIGDSRLYRSRGGTLVQLSRDQTLYQQALDLGALDPLPPRNILLQALGPAPSIAPVVESHAWLPGDRYLLCSDGLYNEVPHHEMEAVLAGLDSEGEPDAIASGCKHLVELALDAGGRDNVTALIVCCERTPG
jgi:protein phosphatase